MSGRTDIVGAPLRVWAPHAQVVAADLGDRLLTMRPDGDGWWESDGPVPTGTDYAFRLDGGDPLPDPRSPWQPDGVHAASRTFDTGAHRWADAGWSGIDVRGAVLYELHIGTFTTQGTLDAALARLPHLVDLGVQVVQLMPVAAFPGRAGWGYDGVDLYAVHEPYGGPAALQRFVDGAHQLGLGVSLDVVYNHLGPSGNYLSRYGPYFTDRHRTPWGEAVNLDGPGSPGVRAFVLENAVRWLRDFHLDALRLDAVHALADDSPVHLLAELATAVEQLADELGRPLGLIAESDLNDVAMVTPVAEGGLGMTAQWDDDVHHAIHAFLTGERHGYYADFGSYNTLAKALAEVFVHNGGFSSFRGRAWGAPVPAEVSGHRFVVSTTTHDQVGNRGRGDRPAARLSEGRQAISAALLLTTGFTPMLFMGEEWSASTPWMFFTDHADPDLARSIREGRAREFGDHGWADLYGDDAEPPDPQDPATVAASTLDWAESGRGHHARIRAFYRDLIALRARIPDLRSGDRRATSIEHDAAAGWLRIRRRSVLTVMNLAADERVVPLADADAWSVALAWDSPAEDALTDTGLRLPADGVAVLVSR
ncbi:malto-oligosyltrehalose trehalohydrolase [Occultella glacieicola]|uniref:Malto-oligosyltrehalose trehalohydrolase n=1 Tax=Occultella glacieicola TaxID=2518684 RepID=A0ABY2DXN3_9MICO|nr:malto-oligosyltrehalose trehalohydrolase [Occultella glacieicola]TDE88897.1 malto-oligosyltrehalose trehalohydrolase [Occultella glacieicola]